MPDFFNKKTSLNKGLIIISLNELAFFFISFILLTSACVQNNKSMLPNELQAKNEVLSDTNNIVRQQDFLTPYLEAAKKQHKKVFIIFGSKSCAFCRRFDNYHHDPEISKILGKYFIIIMVDVIRSDMAKDLYKLFWKPGMPMWVILDSEGNFITDSDSGKNGGNIGYPHKAEDIKYYINALKSAGMIIGDAECRVLEEKLRSYGPS
jgi:thioredoxin-related protein